MKALIIGGTRHLGVAIAHELAAHGYGVHAFHRGSTTATLPPDVTELFGDAREGEALETVLRNGGYDAVVDTILQSEDLDRL
ncbi:MAG: NAD-dependent epimerase/dehydratase family protein, partial [Nitrospiraceae bacterium]|nr:NAD-dependent epimerase/dehydratase family protein [Nitrospiraceae bacterium]